MFAPLVPYTSVAWVSQASIDNGMIRSYGLRKRIEPVRNCRNVTKSDMKYNDLMPKMKVDPESYVCPIVIRTLFTFIGEIGTDLYTDCGSGWDGLYG